MLLALPTIRLRGKAVAAFSCSFCDRLVPPPSPSPDLERLQHNLSLQNSPCKKLCIGNRAAVVDSLERRREDPVARPIAMSIASGCRRLAYQDGPNLNGCDALMQSTLAITTHSL